MNNDCLRVAVAGIGGFAGAHHTAWIGLEEAGLVKVEAACDPQADALEERIGRYRFRERHVSVYRDFSEMIDSHRGRLDLASIVTPIFVHARQHRACVENGIACYLEKPPTLDPQELTEMIAVERNARRSTQVGFNYISQPWRQALKARVLSGEFGALKRVCFKGTWRRSQSYYGRNGWAGKLIVGDSVLLDSCCGNAMAHYVHNLLFHGGTEGVMSWAAPERVEAELYRANPIEGADTVFARGILVNGVEFRIAATHACETASRHTERIECEKAAIEIDEQGGYKIRWKDGGIERKQETQWSLRENLQRYVEYVRGVPDRLATTLSDCRPMVHLNALLYVAAGAIHTIGAPSGWARRVGDDERETYLIAGVEEACERLVQNGEFPSETGVPWGRAGGCAAAEQVSELRRVLSEMRR